MPSVSKKATPIEATLINASVANASELPAELKAAKEAAQADGNHNLIVVDNKDPENQKVYNLKVNEMQLDGVELGQQISSGKIQGTIKFMDHGGDDVKAAAPVKPAAPPKPAIDPLYGLSTKDAAEVILSLAVWGEGSSEDEDKFGRDYSPREQQDLVSKFQQEVGAPVSGQWDQETFVKAKDFVVKNYAEGETMTDGQFKNFLGDLQGYYKGTLGRKQVEENLDGYIYDQRKNPVHAPGGSDTVGFAQLLKGISPADQKMLGLAIEETDPEEAKVLGAILRNEMPAAEAKAWLLENFGDAEDMPGVMKPGADIGAELSPLLWKATQEDYLDISRYECSGEFDQKSYDALRQMFAEENKLDMNPQQLTAFTNSALKEMLAYTKGEIDKDTLHARIEKLAGK